MQRLPTAEEKKEEDEGGGGEKGGGGGGGGRSCLAFLRPVAAASGSVATDPARLPLFATLVQFHTLHLRRKTGRRGIASARSREGVSGDTTGRIAAIPGPVNERTRSKVRVKEELRS